MQWIDGVYHELEQSVPEVAAGVQDGNVGGPPPRVLARHHARHGRARHARLEFRVGFHKTTFGGYVSELDTEGQRTHHHYHHHKSTDECTW